MLYAATTTRTVPSLVQLAGFALLCLAGVAHPLLPHVPARHHQLLDRPRPGHCLGLLQSLQRGALPDAAFHGWFRAAFTFVIPMLLVANVPVKALTHRLDTPWEWPLLLVTSITCYAISEAAWRFSVRHYTSASS
jgi:ABC-2 type transport system permease protein